MLSARFNLSKPLGELIISPAGIKWNNGSYITPFSNPALTFYVFTMTNYWAFCVSEKTITTPPLFKQAGEALTLHQSYSLDDEPELYSAFEQLEGEAALIEARFSPYGENIRFITRGVGACPLYIAESQKVIYLDWDFYEVAKHNSSPSIDIQQIVKLSSNAVVTFRTPFQHVAKLPVGTVAQWNGNNIDIKLPNSHIDVNPRIESDNLSELLLDLLVASLDRKSLSPNGIMLELSGGLDSSAIACALGNTMKTTLITGGVLVHGDNGRSDQTLRRNALVERYNTDDFEVDIADYLPFEHFEKRKSDYGLPMCEIYVEAFDMLWDIAKDKGAAVVFSGMGGDELFPIYQTEQASADATETGWADAYLSCLTPTAREATKDMLFGTASIDPAHYTTLIGMERHSPLIMRHGLWPIYPFASPDIISFCRSLPLSMRRDKNILRQLINQNLPEKQHHLFIDHIKEHFYSSAEFSLTKHKALFVDRIKSSPLNDLGILRAPEVITQIESYLSGRDRDSLAHIYYILLMDRFVRTYWNSSFPT